MTPALATTVFSRLKRALSARSLGCPLLCWLALVLCCPALCCPKAWAQEARRTLAPGPRLRSGTPDLTVATSLSPARRWAGLSLGVLGAGALATGWAYELRAEKLRDRLYLLEPKDPRVSDTRSSAQWSSKMSWLGVGGGALGIAALQLALPPAERVPRWSYAFGAAGVALLGIGAYELASSKHCTSDEAGDCGPTRHAAERGALLLATGFPLLTIPLTYALRRLFPNEKAKLSVRPQISTRSWSLKVQGRF